MLFNLLQMGGIYSDWEMENKLFLKMWSYRSEFDSLET